MILWNRLTWSVVPLNTPRSICLFQGSEEAWLTPAGQHIHRSKHRSGRRHLPRLTSPLYLPAHANAGLSAARSEQGHRERRVVRGEQKRKGIGKATKARIPTCDCRLLSPAGYEKILQDCCYTYSCIFSSWENNWVPEGCPKLHFRARDAQLGIQGLGPLLQVEEKWAKTLAKAGPQLWTVLALGGDMTGLFIRSINSFAALLDCWEWKPTTQLIAKAST